MTKTIKFYQSDQSKWGEYQSQVSAEICEKLASHKDFEVKFDFIKPSKTWNQVKAAHKLFDLIAPRLSESWGNNFSPEGAKHFLKVQFGFVERISAEGAITEAARRMAKKKALGEKITKQDFHSLFNEASKEFQTRSLASATKEEMIDLIDRIENLAAKMGWTEVKLESDEKRALVQYYEQLNKE